MRLGAAALVILLASPLSAEDVTDAPGAILRGLDKVSGVATDLTIKNGGSAAFGTLQVSVSDCRLPKDNPAADAYAHVKIANASGTVLFDGWMVATSPALSALDDPRYDVWVMRCISS